MSSTDDRLAEVRQAAETLLANTVIETFDVRVEAAQHRARGIERGGRAGAGGLMPARIGVVTFPGSLDDHDALRAVRLSGAEPVSALARQRHPGRRRRGDPARRLLLRRLPALRRDLPVRPGDDRGGQGRPTAGMPVLGICNGFQILCEAHLLPGALIRNDVRTFVCKDQDLRVESADTTWTRDFSSGQRDHHRAQERRGRLRRRRGDAGPAGGGGPGGLPLRRRQPQRLAATTSPGSATSGATWSG